MTMSTSYDVLTGDASDGAVHPKRTGRSSPGCPEEDRSYVRGDARDHRRDIPPAWSALGLYSGMQPSREGRPPSNCRWHGSIDQPPTWGCWRELVPRVVQTLTGRIADGGA
jgi:hypothetical protein